MSNFLVIFKVLVPDLCGHFLQENIFYYLLRITSGINKLAFGSIVYSITLQDAIHIMKIKIEVYTAEKALFCNPSCFLNKSLL